MAQNKLILVILVASCISGCATVGSYQAQCEKEFSAFPDVVECLKAAVANDPRPSTDARLKLYLLKADQLSGKVQRGEMTDVDARVALQELYVKLKDDAAAERRANRPVKTECSESFGKLECTAR